ncbi:hypothetical protein [Holdemania sp. 1001302B_160321_E10]|uniref:hypothetical protein n=1 Tax=Holdemania sp. 1001302B_160321_E10 TaxID=2787120 RepID=UPI001897588A|nr:hypothetical protein [Holdemania sp. 1001302B_160321_E10]
MGNKIFTISEDQYQHNIPLVREYIRNKEMYNRDFAKLCGVNNSTMQTILAGQFRGTINTWQKIKQTTKLDIQFDDKIALQIPAKQSREDEFIKNYLIKHLTVFGNVYVNAKRIKWLGGPKKVLDILQAFGLNCEFSEDEKGTKSIIKLREK